VFGHCGISWVWLERVRTYGFDGVTVKM
jgi:hypothetical protein